MKRRDDRNRKDAGNDPAKDPSLVAVGMEQGRFLAAKPHELDYSSLVDLERYIRRPKPFEPRVHAMIGEKRNPRIKSPAPQRAGEGLDMAFDSTDSAGSTSI